MIYLDNAATTPVSPQTAMSVMEALVSFYGNPESHHAVGMKASEAVFKARKQICELFGSENANQIIFTSGGTEANNLAILGLEKHLKRIGKTHIITSETEHKSVIEAVKRLGENGFDVTFLSPGRKGYISVDQVRDAICEYTGLVSIMYVNNETGCMNEIYGIQNLIASKDHVLFHCDCVQAAGFYDLGELKADFISVSAHKFHGPKGIGCLYAKTIETLFLLENILYGGEQELYKRPGTLNVSGIIGFATAVKDVPKSPFGWQECYLTKLLTEKIDGFHRNFPQTHCSPRIASYRFDGVDGDTLVAALSIRGLCCSVGAACNSNSVEPSYVLTASGLTDVEASETIRVSFANDTSKNELEEAADIIAEAVSFLRSRTTEGGEAIDEGTVST